MLEWHLEVKLPFLKKHPRLVEKDRPNKTEMEGEQSHGEPLPDPVLFHSRTAVLEQ